MKKRVISLVLALTFVFASVFASNAATSNQGATVGSITTKNPTAISYKDISRLAEQQFVENKQKLLMQLNTMVAILLGS